MNYIDCVNNISTFSDLKRVANEYVIDYKRLTFDELKAAMLKTAPQFSNRENVYKVIQTLKLNDNPDIRILFEIIMIRILLNKDNFSSLQKNLEDDAIAYEQSVLDMENEEEDLFKKDHIKLLSFVIQTAWENNSAISVDEQNLIDRLKKKLGILDDEFELLQAHNSIFPKPGNVLHTRDDIIATRKVLQQKGILFVVRDSQGNDYDIIPDEIAKVIRDIYDIDIKDFSYQKLLESRFVKKKAYLVDILQKAGVETERIESIDSLSKKIRKRIKAHCLLGGFSARDGLNITELIKWCNELSIPSKGAKNELIDRIIEYYDDIQEIEINQEDERALYYEYYEDLAARNLDKLRKQGVINKDLDCEHRFEQATNYLFEKILKNKPLMLKGTEHPDGMLSFGNKLILWDNKSKETAVNLGDHIKQFDRYIKGEDKIVPVFLVIGPSFTEESPKECLKYSMMNDTSILLITASELKLVAQNWKEKHDGDEEAFPLGYFKQNGRFDISLISFN